MKTEITARQALIVVLIILMAVLHSLTGNGQTVKDSLCACPKYITASKDTLQVYVGKKGGKYVVRKSAKGNIYKMYIKTK